MKTEAFVANRPAHMVAAAGGIDTDFVKLDPPAEQPLQVARVRAVCGEVVVRTE